jgi:hypothetical protein
MDCRDFLKLFVIRSSHPLGFDHVSVAESGAARILAEVYFPAGRGFSDASICIGFSFVGSLIV